MSQRRAPIAATALAGLLWGSSFIVVKHGLRSIDPYWFVLLRFATAAAIAVSYAALTGRLRTVGRFLRDPLIIWLGVSNGIGFALQFKGQTLTTAGKAALFVNSSTILVAIASRYVFRERFTQAKVAAIVVGMIGVFLVTTGGAFRLTAVPELTGDLLVLAAAVLWSAFILLDKRIVASGDVDVRALTAAMTTVTALTILPLTLALGRGGPPPLDGRLWVVLYTAIFCTVLPFLLWSWGLKSISATSSASGCCQASSSCNRISRPVPIPGCRPSSLRRW